MAKTIAWKFWFKVKPAFYLGLLLFIAGAPIAQALAPADTLLENQWYLKRIAADKAWDVANSSPQVVIAVIDTGIMVNHPDLTTNIWFNPKEIPGNKIDDDHNGYVDDINGWDFVNNTANVEPKFKPGYTEAGINHGTIVAGILAAQGNNQIGIAGVTWNSQIMSLKALDDTGKADMKSVVKAINYAIDNGAKIINLSFVGTHSSAELNQAMARARQAGVVIVAAAGNDLAGGEGQNLDKTPIYPACSDGAKGENLVIGVAATGPLDAKASFSAYGRCIDLTAPGVSIFSTAYYAPNVSNKFDKYYDGYWSGTSFAVPMVSATLALMMQANPTLRPDKLINLLLKSTDYNYSVNPKFIGKLGRGRLNVQSAVLAAQTAKDEETADILLFNDSETKGLIKRVTAKGVVKAKFKTFDNVNINVASGDFNGDKKIEIAVAPQVGLPEVRLYNEDGKLLNKFLAFESSYKGGVSLAAGDFYNDGIDELAVAPFGKRLSEIRIFDKNFKIKKTWQAYSANFKSGLNLAAGDVNGDRRIEIVSAPADQGGSHIKIFSPDGKVVSQFFAFDPSIVGGFKIAVADAYSSLGQTNQIIVASGQGQIPYIHIFDYQGNLNSEFFAYNVNFKGGINVAAADLDNDGQAEIIAGAGPGGGPHLMLYKNDGSLLKAFYTDKKTLTQGVNVASFVKK